MFSHSQTLACNGGRKKKKKKKRNVERRRRNEKLKCQKEVRLQHKLTCTSMDQANSMTQFTNFVRNGLQTVSESGSNISQLKFVFNQAKQKRYKRGAFIGKGQMEGLVYHISSSGSSKSLPVLQKHFKCTSCTLIALQMHCMFCNNNNNNNNPPARITVREVTEQKLNILLEWPYRLSQASARYVLLNFMPCCTVLPQKLVFL